MDFNKYSSKVLSGIRFIVTYSLFYPEEKAIQLAKAICVEETVEFPAQLLPKNSYWQNMVGVLEKFERKEKDCFTTIISYPIEAMSPDIVQLLNVIYGNISMIEKIRVERVDLPDEILSYFKGPRFGIEGLRHLTNVYDRPLLCTAIKPMGLTSEDLAQMAFDCACGGIDIIKDDHGLTDQTLAPYCERVSRCAEAVIRANRESGENCLYAPNVTAPAEKILERAIFAKRAGAQALMIIPSLVGWDVVRMLSENSEIGLPILCHPSFNGVYFTSKISGFSAFFMYGQLIRLAGGDASFFPNFIGRFASTTKQDCQDIIMSTKIPMGNIKPIFPGPGGGNTLETIPKSINLYKKDVIYIMGGGLHLGKSLIDSCKQFRKYIESQK